MPQPAADLEALLHHAAWLRRLAEPLLANPADAEDALQDAWIAALEHPPRRQWNGAAWLARVVGNCARRVQRDARRRATREATAARSESTASAQEIASRVEIETQLALHVLALEPNPQRAILLRYYEDLPPREIASLRAPVAGSYALRWSLRSAIHGNTVDSGEHSITIAPEPREQVLRLGPSPAELESAIEKLRANR